MKRMRVIFPSLWLASLATTTGLAGNPDLILHHGKIVTADKQFSIRTAVAVEGNRIIKVGGDVEILKLKGPRTELVDLQGRTVLPGLIDLHTHPSSASMTEFDHPIPTMESVPDVLDYIKARADVVPAGEWIQLHQVFITRLQEQRYPSRAELDRVAPNHPVLFRTEPDAALNSLALKLSGIDRDFKVKDGGAGFVEKDATTGEPTGMLRNCTRFVKVQPSGKQPTEQDHLRRLRMLFQDYNSVGITTICDRDAKPEAVGRYQKLRDGKMLPLRLNILQHIETIGSISNLEENIYSVARDPLFQHRAKDDWLRLIGVKIYLDGGMLTGSAYLREPWGVSRTFAITDPEYRGVLFVPKERLVTLVCAAVKSGLQFTAHSVGDGAVHALMEAYAEVSKTTPIRGTRPCITHANFLSREAVEYLPKLGVALDIQPVWLYLDTRTLVAQFGNERLRWFQPWRSFLAAGGIVGGGSDHMQKIGSLRSVNLYNPFLGMATAITRRAKSFAGQLHPEECLTREQAIRLYTSNNAWLLFLEDKLGSIEPGKLADFVVLDTDLLTCPEEKIAGTRVLRTYLDGRLVYTQQE